MKEECRYCRGEGKLAGLIKICPKCNGTGEADIPGKMDPK